MAKTLACRARNPGSIPGVGVLKKFNVRHRGIKATYCYEQYGYTQLQETIRKTNRIS